MVGKEIHTLTVQNNGGSRDIFSNRDMILKILPVAFLGIASVLYGVRIMSKGPEESATTERKRAMFLTRQNFVANQGIPPIDLSAPAGTETATFALG